MNEPLPLFFVQVQGFDPVLTAARSRGAAVYSRFLDFTDAFPCSFREFLGQVSVWRSKAPAPSLPYDYVRRNYGIDVSHGTRVELQNEGLGLDGRRGTVTLPDGASTAHIHVVLDGERHASIVHPFSVKILSEEHD